MKHFVRAFAFLAVICCLTSAAPRPQPGLLGGGGGGLGGLLGGAGGVSPLQALKILEELGALGAIGTLGAPTGPTNVQSSGGDTTLKGVGNEVITGFEANGNLNAPIANNVLGGGY